MVHTVWLFACDDDAARRRLMERNGFSVEEADQRLASQRAWQDRAPASDRVFHNDGAIGEFEAQVSAAYAETARLAKTGGFLCPSITTGGSSEPPNLVLEGRHNLFGELLKLLDYDRLGRANRHADVDFLQAGVLLLDAHELLGNHLRRAYQP